MGTGRRWVITISREEARRRRPVKSTGRLETHIHTYIYIDLFRRCFYSKQCTDKEQNNQTVKIKNIGVCNFFEVQECKNTVIHIIHMK